jgi:hypothetical protein
MMIGERTADLAPKLERLVEFAAARGEPGALNDEAGILRKRSVP